MKTAKLFVLGLLGMSAIFVCSSFLAAVEIVPASMQDILTALGPDAQGLNISQEKLPDLFVLTASRIEENPKKFIVEQSYTEGRWKGGKAVIEYARDLSYTLVSVYDKHGNRQRIYSVRTSYSEHVAHQASLASAKAAASSVTPSETTTPESAPPVEPVEETGSSHATASEPSPAQPGINSESKGGFEWDEAKGTYVAVSPSAAAPETLSPPPEVVATPAHAASKRKKHHHSSETTVATAKTSNDSAPVDSQGGVWLPANTKAPPPEASEVKVANTTWVEKSESKPVEEKPHRKHRHHKEEASTPAQTPSTAATEKNPVVAAAPVSASASVPATDEWVPSSIQQPPIQEARQLPEKPSHKRRVKAPPPETPVSAPIRVAEVAKPVTPAPMVSAPVASAFTPAPAPAPTPVSAQDAVPSTEDLLANPQANTGPDTSEGDHWVPKPVSKPALEAVPETPAAPVQVAMIPKQAPVDNSVENLLKMAEKDKTPASRDSDAWVPQKNAAAKPDADINKELIRIRAEEKAQAAPKPVVKVRRDINNPEEGVLPVSTFEKFSGPMYGRHREYERRFFPGKKTKATVSNYDFYVEEVDRKKEIHNVYFYKHQKGKAPKLVAVERHEKISFLGNYDIEKEDKGKISTYN